MRTQCVLLGNLIFDIGFRLSSCYAPETRTETCIAHKNIQCWAIACDRKCLCIWVRKVNGIKRGFELSQAEQRVARVEITQLQRAACYSCSEAERPARVGAAPRIAHLTSELKAGSCLCSAKVRGCFYFFLTLWSLVKKEGKDIFLLKEQFASWKKPHSSSCFVMKTALWLFVLGNLDLSSQDNQKPNGEPR